LTDHPDKKINKETSELIVILDQMGLNNMLRIFHTAAGEYIFISTSYGAVPKYIIF
jgi:hypothetical protein